MSLNEKLDKYSKQGDSTKFKVTYNKVKELIESNVDKNKYKVNIYLQGSYVNNTNIEKDSDVDIIVELENMFNSNISELSKSVQKKFHSEFKDSSLTLFEFKNHIKTILDNANYNYIEKSKCIKVISGIPLNADLIICNQYRKYDIYPHYDRGILFKDDFNRNVISFPKIHKDNMTKKNSDMPNFKETVRIFKNFKNELLNLNLISEDEISSYHIESLIYNVPNDHFKSFNLENRINSIIFYLNSNYDKFSSFVTPCHKKYLFGNSNNQWKNYEALNFLKQIKLTFLED